MNKIGIIFRKLNNVHCDTRKRMEIIHQYPQMLITLLKDIIPKKKPGTLNDLICSLVPRLFCHIQARGKFKGFSKIYWIQGQWSLNSEHFCFQKNPSLKVVFFQSLSFASMLLTISDYINTDTLLSRFVLNVFLPLKPKTLVPIKANTVEPWWLELWRETRKISS